MNVNDLGGLPAPVARYFRRVPQQGQPLIQLARFRQVGTLRTDARGDSWLTFEASQIVVPPAIGFLWNARIAMARLLPSAALRWSAIDENTALATVTDNGVTVSLEFRFDDAGEVAGIYTPARWGTFVRSNAS